MNDIIKSIEEIVTQSERFKSSFFWNPPKNAWARRKYEEYNSRKKIDWEEGGVIFIPRSSSLNAVVKTSTLKVTTRKTGKRQP